MKKANTAACHLLLPALLSLSLISGGKKAEAVSHRVLEAGPYVYFRSRDPEVRVFADAESFTSFYTALHRSRVPSPKPPQVDFTQSLVIFVSAGEKPTAGFSVELLGMSRRKDTLEVEVLLIEPAGGSFQAQVITHPYLIATATLADYERVELVNDRGELLDRVLKPDL
jgi:hypothetical protein